LVIAGEAGEKRAVILPDGKILLMGRGTGIGEQAGAMPRGVLRVSMPAVPTVDDLAAKLTDDQKFMLTDFAGHLNTKMTVAWSEFSHHPSGSPDLLAVSDIPGAEPFAITASGGIASVDRPLPEVSIVLDADQLKELKDAPDRRRPPAIRARSSVTERDMQATRYYRYHGGPPSRDDGAAVVFYDGDKADEYWLDGRRMSGMDAILTELQAREAAGISHPTWEESGEQPTYQTVFYDQDDVEALRITVSAKSDYEAEKKAREIYHHQLGETKPRAVRSQTTRQEDATGDDPQVVSSVQTADVAGTRINNSVSGTVGGNIIQVAGDIDELVL